MDPDQAPPRDVPRRGERRLTGATTSNPATDEAAGLDEHLGFLLRLAYQRASANLTAATGASGVTSMQFATLFRVRELGPLSQNELGRRVGMPPANIHATVRRLVADGLLRTRPSPTDRRLSVVDLTAVGALVLEELLPAATAANAHTLSALAADEQRLLMDLLRKVASPASES